jgi:hypothetical protein
MKTIFLSSLLAIALLNVSYTQETLRADAKIGYEDVKIDTVSNLDYFSSTLVMRAESINWIQFSNLENVNKKGTFIMLQTEHIAQISIELDNYKRFITSHDVKYLSRKFELQNEKFIITIPYSQIPASIKVTIYVSKGMGIGVNIIAYSTEDDKVVYVYLTEDEFKRFTSKSIKLLNSFEK